MLCLVVSVPVSVAYYYTGPALEMFGFSGTKIGWATVFSRWSILGVVPTQISFQLQQYLQARQDVMPGVYAQLVGAVLNVVFNQVGASHCRWLIGADPTHRCLSCSSTVRDRGPAWDSLGLPLAPHSRAPWWRWCLRGMWYVALLLLRIGRSRLYPRVAPAMGRSFTSEPPAPAKGTP